MFFRKRYTTPNYELKPIVGIRWMNTEIYDKSGRDNELLKTERKLQFLREDNSYNSWEDVYNNWNNPVYLDGKNG